MNDGADFDSLGGGLLQSDIKFGNMFLLTLGCKIITAHFHVITVHGAKQTCLFCSYTQMRLKI